MPTVEKKSPSTPKKVYVELENADNIKYFAEKNTLLIKVDLSQENGVTSTEKSIKVANSKGWKGLDGTEVNGLKISFLLIKPNK